MYIALGVIGFLVLCVVVFYVLALKYKARMQHYQFAHDFLPTGVFTDTNTILIPLVSASGSSPEGRAHLVELWDAVGEGMTGDDVVSSESLKYQMVPLGHPNSTAFLIQLPPPKKKPEAYYAAIVFDAPGLSVGKVRHLRYFVLEFHGEKNGTPKTWLAEWKPKDNGKLEYVDHGEGPGKDPRVFLKQVQEIIKISGSQP